MPCPVTLGFFHALQHSACGKAQTQKYELLVDHEGSFPALRADALQELVRDERVYDHRAQYAIQAVIAAMHVKAPTILAPVLQATDPEEMLSRARELSNDLEDLLLVSRMKRKSDGANTHKLSERLVLRGGLSGLIKQLVGFRGRDYRSVGYGTGDAFHGLHLPADLSLKIGRKLLSIRE